MHCAALPPPLCNALPPAPALRAMPMPPALSPWPASPSPAPRRVARSPSAAAPAPTAAARIRPRRAPREARLSPDLVARWPRLPARPFPHTTVPVRAAPPRPARAPRGGGHVGKIKVAEVGGTGGAEWWGAGKAVDEWAAGGCSHGVRQARSTHAVTAPGAGGDSDEVQRRGQGQEQVPQAQEQQVGAAGEGEAGGREEASAAATPASFAEVQQAGAAEGAWQAGGGGSAGVAPGSLPSHAGGDCAEKHNGALTAWGSEHELSVGTCLAMPLPHPTSVPPFPPQLRTSLLLPNSSLPPLPPSGLAGLGLSEKVQRWRRVARGSWVTCLGGKLPKGVLLVGQDDSSTGDRGRGEMPLFSASGSAFTDMLVRAAARRDRELFAANKAAPCTVFLGEIDAIGGSRNPKGQQWSAVHGNDATLKQNQGG
ncbi:unnamed protein product [Closterium sp. Naga37s-1]|nr:unnamed protein product [Closterium sp. Naga37s-1]